MPQSGAAAGEAHGHGRGIAPAEDVEADSARTHVGWFDCLDAVFVEVPETRLAIDLEPDLDFPTRAGCVRLRVLADFPERILRRDVGDDIWEWESPKSKVRRASFLPSGPERVRRLDSRGIAEAAQMSEHRTGVCPSAAAGGRLAGRGCARLGAGRLDWGRLRRVRWSDVLCPRVLTGGGSGAHPDVARIPSTLNVRVRLGI
jgi:hypothetical protein